MLPGERATAMSFVAVASHVWRWHAPGRGMRAAICTTPPCMSPSPPCMSPSLPMHVSLPFPQSCIHRFLFLIPKTHSRCHVPLYRSRCGVYVMAFTSSPTPGALPVCLNGCARCTHGALGGVMARASSLTTCYLPCGLVAHTHSAACKTCSSCSSSRCGRAGLLTRAQWCVLQKF